MGMSIESRKLRFFKHTGGDCDPTSSAVGKTGSSSRLPSSTQHSTMQAIISTENNGKSVSKIGMRAVPLSTTTTISLSQDEKDLFNLLRKARNETHIHTTLRVAGGWVRDKLLATPEFQAYHKVFQVGSAASSSNNIDPSTQQQRLTSKFQRQALRQQNQQPSMGRQGTKVLVNGNTQDSHQYSLPVDIDIALDDMVGREFADHLNQYLSKEGKETISVGVVLKNPEKSKHLETATMKVGSFWIDFVNLRAEEYTQDSRIPDLMRIGTAAEDAFRRDLTINALFYNINTGHVEDWTGRGISDLRKGVVATPLPPLTTLLDDPLRVLRSVRFAARLRFTMDEELIKAAQQDSVRQALDQKVSRERVGGEVDLMLRSPDPVGAMRLLINLNLAETVFPLHKYMNSNREMAAQVLSEGLELLSATHDHLADCRITPPIWCQGNSLTTYNADEFKLIQNEEARRYLWYAAFLKPAWDKARADSRKEKDGSSNGARSKKSNRSYISMLLVDDLKRPIRDAENIEKILRAAEEFTELIKSGGEYSSTMVLMSEIRVRYNEVSSDISSNDRHRSNFECFMNGRSVDAGVEEDPVWAHAMEFRSSVASILNRIGPFWRASLFLSLAQELWSLDCVEYVIEGDVLDESYSERRDGVIESFDIVATSLQQLGLIGIWNEKPLLDGGRIKKLLPGIPKGPAFKEVMEAQVDWMLRHPGGELALLEEHLLRLFPDYVDKE